ncbi:hypothetical protein AVEN_211267-1 [Araneus ventricosus]|uniref:Uncharacterized protein n=1 Tax=Araneus ventricosus TaxID=182803 RepID=A0A4Y2NJ01_ARAVE|nr:hypothetical protein AVEN_211267-1 [Araneus ventricosus]
MPFLARNIKVSKTKGLVRPNQNKNASVSSKEESQFFQPEVISEEKSIEALDTVLQANCQEVGNKVLSLKTTSNINQESLEDAESGSEPEQENERRFREVDNEIIEKD